MAASYTYKPISPEPGTIRLIRLFKSLPTDPIRCELFEASLQEDIGITYQALSYTWGCNAVTETITVEEEHAGGGRISFTLNVTTNLHTALRYIRSRDLDLVLWIDAICIDQGNPHDKSVQIGQMRLVYEKAEEVLIWLGHGGDENVEAAMEAMCRLHDEARADRKAWRDPARRPEIACLIFRQQFANVPGSMFQKHVEAFKGLLARPWFQRVWIIQEVASARSAVVLCGSRSAPAAIFALMPSLLGVEVNKHTQAVLDIIPGHSRQESWWNERRDLLYLLKMFASARTSEPRDRIYALLGISSDASNSEVFRPDYTVSFEEVLHNTLSFFLFGSTSLGADKTIWLPNLSLTALAQYANEPKSLILYILRWAGFTKHYNTTKQLLIHHSFDIESSVLYDLKENGYGEVIEHYILHTAVDLATTNKEGETLLQTAVRKKDVNTTKLLLEKAGFSIDDIRLWCLKGEMMSGDFTAVRLLIMEWNKSDNLAIGQLEHPALKAPETARESKPGWKKAGRRGLFSSFASWKDGDKNVSRPMYYGVDTKKHRDAWGSSLFLAARRGYLPIARCLLDEVGEYVDVNFKDRHGRTALSFAAEAGYLEVLMLLMERGADRAAKDNSGRRIVDWLEDTAVKRNRSVMGKAWGSHLAEWRASLYGSEFAL